MHARTHAQSGTQRTHLKPKHEAQARIRVPVPTGTLVDAHGSNWLLGSADRVCAQRRRAVVAVVVAAATLVAAASVTVRHQLRQRLEAFPGHHRQLELVALGRHHGGVTLPSTGSETLSLWWWLLWLLFSFTITSTAAQSLITIMVIIHSMPFVRPRHACAVLANKQQTHHRLAGPAWLVAWTSTQHLPSKRLRARWSPWVLKHTSSSTPTPTHDDEETKENETNPTIKCLLCMYGCSGGRACYDIH